MSYVLSIEPAFLRIVVQGVITQQDLHALNREITAIEASSPIAPHRLIDLSAVTPPHLTYRDVQTFAENRSLQPLANTVKLAIVASRPIHLGFARMYEHVNQRPRVTIEIFATAADAEAWLSAE